MDNSYDERLSRICYYVCLGISVLLVIVCIVLRVLNISVTQLNPYPCSLYTMFGLYCFGCGGTRAVAYLLEGDFVKSFIHHPVVLYTAVLVVCYMISHTISILSKGKIKAMLFRPIYFYIMIAIILIQWIVKNALILINGTYILG